MRISGSIPIDRQHLLFYRARICALVFLLLIVVQACGGPVSPNYPPASTQNPNPGVTLDKIVVTPSNSIILLAEKRQLFATGIYSNGTSQDITSQATWSASSQPAFTNFVSVNSAGMATASGVGAAVIEARIGSVVGVLQLVVSTNSFTSGTMSILPVPYKSTSIDIGYLPLQSKVQSSYVVQAVNLDADQLSSVLPPAVSLVASIPMPAGFIPNATASNASNALVAVISYTSPNVQIIDGSNNPLDLSSNTLIATYTAPVKSTATINGVNCMICAALVNPLNDQLILSTADGYFAMDMTAGTFAALPFSPAPLPSANLSLNPSAPQPYILSTIPSAGAIQLLNLSTNVVSTYNNITPAPATAAIDVITGYAAIADGNTAVEELVDLTNLSTPQTSPAQPLGTCTSTQPFMNMASMGTSANSVVLNIVHTLFTSQTGGNCVGFQIWPTETVPGGFNVANPSLLMAYGYGPMPPTPDGSPFVNGVDPNSIGTFNSVYDKKDYGFLIDGSQRWIAKINLATAVSLGNISNGLPFPIGVAIPPADLGAGIAGDAVEFLPTPARNFTVSAATLDFGTVVVGTPSPTAIINLANIGIGNLTPQISVQGANASDFFMETTCSVTLLAQSSCAINITFTPAATGARSASLTVAQSGEETQTIPLTGTGG
jgi:hypothetical protein